MNERLTEPERAFAEQRHNLIYSFLNANSLPVNEFYDVVAFGYLRAVRRYHREKKLQKYSFNTIAWQAMRSEVGNKRKADRIRDALIAYSLNDVTEDRTELGEFVRSAKDSFRELEEQESLQELLAELMPALTEKQRGHIVATLEGYKAREIMQQQRESVQEYHANNRAIKKAAREVLPAFLCRDKGNKAGADPGTPRDQRARI